MSKTIRGSRSVSRMRSGSKVIKSSWRRAARIASRRAVDETLRSCILLDVLLPGKNGFEVCREVRASGLDTPIIFLSALAQESDRISGLNLGANDYVVKPFSSSESDGTRARAAAIPLNAVGRIDGASNTSSRTPAKSRNGSCRCRHPLVEGLDYAGMCFPARGVSGDYYDFFELPSGCFAMLLVDVCGKGMPAALLAASLHAAVRACASAADRALRRAADERQPTAV